MGIGSSGRIVIEIEPTIKRELYTILLQEGMTLREWFLLQTESFIRNHRQLNLYFEYGDPKDSNNSQTIR